MFMQALKNNTWINKCLFFSFFLLLSKDMFIASTLIAQISSDKLFQKGVEAYKNVDFEQAVQSLEQAISMGLDVKEKQAQAFQYLAYARAALGDTARSKAAYLKLLALNPDFDLPVSASPRLREPLLEAQKIYAQRDTRPPTIIVQSLQAVESGKSLTIQAEIKDNSGIENVTLFYKSNQKDKYSSITMKYVQGDEYSATIPAVSVLPPSLDYYIEAFDTRGNGPSRKGSAEDPFFVEVLTPDRQPPQITHTPPDKANESEAIIITALITDNIAIENASVRFHTMNVTDFKSILMKKMDTNQYQAKISDQEIIPPFIEYYITATDKTGNSGFWQSAQNPYRLPVTPLEITEPPVIAEKDEDKEEKKGIKKWLWIGLGAAVVGGVVIGLVGGEGDAEKEATSGSIVIQVPE